MPIQLRILAIIIALLFAGYIFFLVRRSRSDILRQRKWIFLSLLLILGATFVDPGWNIARILGFTAYSTFSIFIILLIVLVFIFRLELSLIVAEKQIKDLVQEVSILKEKAQLSAGAKDISVESSSQSNAISSKPIAPANASLAESTTQSNAHSTLSNIQANSNSVESTTQLNAILAEPNAQSNASSASPNNPENAIQEKANGKSKN